MRRTCIALSLACSAILALPTAAQTLATPKPMSQKYRDAGARPATGRSGSASLEVRALRGLDGTTDLEVTTGQLDAGTTRGVLDKVQVKLLAPDGSAVRTDNSKPAAGYASYAYGGLPLAQPIQVQANVGGLDGRRTDVVTVATDVKLRPDVEAVGLNAVPRAAVDTPVTIIGVMSETNGDVGARATCRLLADGAEIASIPGAWVDAASTVECLFQASFATPGTRQLKLVVSDVAPGDYDPANNEYGATIEIVPASQPFGYMNITAHDNTWSSRFRETGSYRRSDGGYFDGVREFDASGRSQWMGAFAQMDASVSLQDAVVTLEHGFDGQMMPTLTFNAADMPYGWGDGTYGCRNAMYQDAGYAQICTWPGWTDLWIYRSASQATYVVDRARSVGNAYWWWGNWDNSGSTYSHGQFLTFGTVYTAELGLQSGATSRRQSLDAALSPWTYHDDSTGAPRCNSWGNGYEWWSYCSEGIWHNDIVQGGNSASNW